MHTTKKQGLNSADRGDAARQKLIEAGLKVFGQYGFEGASTRQLAAEAGANIAAIPYYFGGKEGLYQAVIEYIAENYCGSVGTLVDYIKEEMKRSNISKAECRILLRRFIEEFARFLLSTRKDSIYISRIISREQLDPTPAFDRIYEGVLKDSHRELSALIGKLTGKDATAPETKIRTQMIFGQIITFKSSREAALRNMGWKEYGEKEITAILAVLESHIDAILTACHK